MSKIPGSDKALILLALIVGGCTATVCTAETISKRDIAVECIKAGGEMEFGTCKR